MFRLLYVLMLLLPLPGLAAGDPAAGEKLAINCVACHGQRGISVNDLWPNLAGQQAAYLRKQIEAFRDGRRNDPLMNTWVARLTDQDIADLAAYYASLPCEADEQAAGSTPGD